MPETTDYSSFSDEQLIVLIRQGDSSAEEDLYGRYKQMVRAKARTYFLVGGDREDIIQEGMIGLYKAVCDFSPERQSSFGPFANLCVTRQIQTAVKSSIRKKHAPLNNYISFEQPLNEAEDPGLSLMDVLLGSSDGNPEEAVISREQSEALSRDIETKLSSMEKRILSLYLNGLSYQQIAQSISKETKSVDNALQRIKKKLSVWIRPDDLNGNG